MTERPTTTPQQIAKQSRQVHFGENWTGVNLKLREDQLWETFVKTEYGSHYECLHGVIEHCYYHLGQIAMLKTMLANRTLGNDPGAP
jgi:hypothetical protein